MVIIPRTVQNMKTWPEGAMGQLQDCFETTDWSIFANEDLEQYTAGVLGYIKYCMDNVTVDKLKRLWMFVSFIEKKVQCSTQLAAV